jgi:hypothetical protein
MRRGKDSWGREARLERLHTGVGSGSAFFLNLMLLIMQQFFKSCFYLLDVMEILRIYL